MNLIKVHISCRDVVVEDVLDTVVGQIHLVFNDEEIGFIDKEIPYDGEF